jgi:hypothetical protein
VKVLVCLILAILYPAIAHAQTAPYLVPAQCLPALTAFSETASPLYVTANSTGVCVKWLCYWDEFSVQYPDAVARITFCGTWKEAAKASSRIATIQKSKDPLKSLNDLGKRIVILPLSDPQFADLPK